MRACVRMCVRVRARVHARAYECTRGYACTRACIFVRAFVCSRLYVRLYYVCAHVRTCIDARVQTHKTDAHTLSNAPAVLVKYWRAKGSMHTVRRMKPSSSLSGRRPYLLNYMDPPIRGQARTSFVDPSSFVRRLRVAKLRQRQLDRCP